MSKHLEAADQIKRLYIRHRNWEDALALAFPTLITAAPGEVITITGPSRAGKTRLIKQLTKLLIGDGTHIPPDNMPIVSILATNCSIRGSFSTRAFTINALSAIKHPIYGLGMDEDNWDINTLKRLKGTSEPTLRPALESGLEARNTKYLFIDEAQHILHVEGGVKNAGAILDSWKCMAQDKGIILVLVGAYPLLSALNTCPHMIGRTHQIHLPRYQESKENLRAFAQIIHTYSQLISLPPNIKSMTEWLEYLHQETFGCIGLLEAWIRSALAMAHALDSEFLEKEHFIKTAKPKNNKEKLLAEIRAGEEALETTYELSPPPPKNTNVNKTRKKKNTPFQKKPKHYPIKGRNK